MGSGLANCINDKMAPELVDGRYAITQARLHYRPVDVYGGKVTVHTGPDHPSHVLLPVIPAK